MRHFFASIDHDKLKEKLKRLDLEPIVFDLLCTYIDSTDGLPLGYQTSQLFALLFLDEFDHFVKERLHIRWYGRYMDDFFLIHPDKDYLQFCLKEIRAFMASLGLEDVYKRQAGQRPVQGGLPGGQAGGLHGDERRGPVHGRAGPALHCGGLCAPGHLYLSLIHI